MKSKICKFCGAEIPFNSDICPDCGESLQSKYRKLPFYLTMISIILIIVYIFLVNNNIISGRMPSTIYSSETPSSNYSSSRKISKKTTSKKSTSKQIVSNSGWDGSVYQVKSWLKSNLKDPSSLKFIEWSKVFRESNGEFSVRVKYRAKNSFGGYSVENKVFYLNSSGRVLRHINY